MLEVAVADLELEAGFVLSRPRHAAYRSSSASTRTIGVPGFTKAA
jgi:hypothetical protein